MSHEIRTPLTSNNGFTDLLMNDPEVANSPSQRHEALDPIKRNSQHLLEIINDLLDLSKIEADQVTMEVLPTSPAELVDAVLQLLQAKADGKGIRLSASYETAIPTQIRTDPTRLRQILLNLVANAIKFTEVGGVNVVVRFVEDATPRLEFDITDTGIGIASEDQERLFQAFGQADASTTRRFGGTGLGLIISKRLAAKMGGDIQLVRSSPGKGSTFRFTLPTGELDHVETVIPKQAPKPTMPTPIESSTTPSKPPLSGFHLLLAEDGPDNQKIITYFLKKAGAEVTLAENGELAVEAALRAEKEGTPFNAILMDMQMPVMDGYQAAQKLRSAHYKGKIIALTANAMSEDRDRCLDAGCDDFASKPVNRAELIEQILRV